MKFIRVLKAENITLNSTPKVLFKYYDTKNYPHDKSKNENYSNIDKYKILGLDNEIIVDNATKNDVIKFYNDTIKEYYDSLKRDMGPVDFMRAIKDGPKLTNNFETAMQGLNELDYNVNQK